MSLFFPLHYLLHIKLERDIITHLSQTVWTIYIFSFPYEQTLALDIMDTELILQIMPYIHIQSLWASN